MTPVPARILASALMCLGQWVLPAAEQEQPRITVRIRQVAGNTMYLDVGTRNGLQTRDTLGIAMDSVGAPSAQAVVTASTETRSVLTFVGDGAAVKAGTYVTLYLLRAPAEIPSSEPKTPAARPVQPEVTSTPRTSGPEPEEDAHGSMALELSATRSATQAGGIDPSTVTRTFATPGIRMNATVPNAVGRFRLRTNMRMSYRYSSTDVINPPASVRVYSAVLERTFQRAPVRMALGRFLSPVETYSGFWDGGFIRLGGDQIGVGAIVGFEPDRWNERPSTALPKATAFVDAERRGDGWRWHGDASVHVLRPRDSLLDHTFVGISQRVASRVLYLSEDLQVDLDPAGGWRVSRLQLRTSVAVGGGFRLNAGASRRESWSPWRLELPFSPRSDRVDAGLAYRGRRGGLSADASLNRDAGGRRSWGATGGYSLVGLPALGPLGLSGTVARWSGPYGTSLTASPGLTLSLSPAWLRVGYQVNRADYLHRLLTTHGVDASLDLPFADAMRLSLRGRVSWGGALSGQSLYMTLYRMF